MEIYNLIPFPKYLFTSFPTKVWALDESYSGVIGKIGFQGDNSWGQGKLFWFMTSILAVLLAVVVGKFYFRRKNVQSSTKTRKNENKGTTTIGSQAAALGFKSAEIDLIKK